MAEEEKKADNTTPVCEASVEELIAELCKRCDSGIVTVIRERGGTQIYQRNWRSWGSLHLLTGQIMELLGISLVNLILPHFQNNPLGGQINKQEGDPDGETEPE